MPYYDTQQSYLPLKQYKVVNGTKYWWVFFYDLKELLCRNHALQTVSVGKD